MRENYQGQALDTTERPTVFISYSWEDDEHRAWVHRLAHRLAGNGVKVALDEWDLAPGDQLPHFMERSIKDNDFVLIVCTPSYRSKSDSRAGGVGYEGDIITAEILTSGHHRKFIPILRVGPWENAAPLWLKGKVYVDLSLPDAYGLEYAKLLASIFKIRTIPAVESTSDPSATPPPRQMKCYLCKNWIEYGAHVCGFCRANITYMSERKDMLQIALPAVLSSTLLLASITSSGLGISIALAIPLVLLVIVPLSVLIYTKLDSRIEPRFTKERSHQG